MVAKEGYNERTDIERRKTDMTLQLPPDAIGKMPNCGLTAMAVVAQCSLAEATEAYQKAYKDVTGRRMQGNWKGRTYRTVRDKALTEHLGITLHRTSVKGMSLKKISQWLEEGTKYMVTSTGHVQVVQKNGGTVYVADQRGCVTMDEYWGARKKVKDVLIIGEVK